MSRWPWTIATVAAGSIALTIAAAAQPAPSPADMPTGDVWIAPSEPNPWVPGRFGQAMPAATQIPTGDFWPAADSPVRIAAPPAPARPDAVEQVASDGAK